MRELEAHIGLLEQDVHDLDNNLRQARAIVEQSQYDVEDELRLDDEIAALRLRVERLGEYRQALELAAEVLREARQQTVSRAIDALGPTIDEYLSVLTGGRYDRVELGDDLSPAVYSREKSALADPDRELSLATKEQVYLACRLALSKLLWPDDGPPLLLDDPLVNFDAQRRDAALRLVQEIAKRRQVILFTCSDTYDRYADSVTVLDDDD